MTFKTLSDSTRNRMHISKRIAVTASEFKISAPILDRLVDLVATVPGRQGNPNQYKALNAVLETITQKQGVSEEDISDLDKKFKEGTMFLREKSWLYRNRHLIEARIRSALGDEISSSYMAYSDSLISKIIGHSSFFGPNLEPKPNNPHNNLAMVEKGIRRLREAGIAGEPAIKHILDDFLPGQPYKEFGKRIGHSIYMEIHSSIFPHADCGGA